MDTIFALSTPPGKSGVAVIRVSGPESLATLKAFGVAPPKPRRAQLASLRLADGSLLDQALVLYFASPHSFTGEAVVEYHIHGSRAATARLLAALSALPSLRPAEAGEFTRRAFLNGKMDLTAAEGLADLIDAETESQRKQAVRFMQGEAALFYEKLRDGILESLALIEAYIDFPDEDIPKAVTDESLAHAQELIRHISVQLADNRAAERVRDGVYVTILGPPNAGKSTLMNRLAKREVAIVSETAGTTRDIIEVHLDINGYSVVVADTAGLREAQDDIEREGIRRTRERAKDADIRLLVLDINEVLPESGWEPFEEFMDDRTIVLLNKADTLTSEKPARIFGITPICISAASGSGIDTVINILSSFVEKNATESFYITRSRHRHHLTQALGNLERYVKLRHIGLELQCEELRRAAVEIGHITGIINADEVLGAIFSRFCIGK